MTAVAAGSGLMIHRIRRVDVGGQPIAVSFLGDSVVFVSGEESILLVAPDGEERRITLHAGAILAVATSADGMITGGDDGHVKHLTPDGEHRTVAIDSQRRWIDCVAIGGAGRMAWSAGKQAFLRTSEGETYSIDLPSTVGGLAFGASGDLLAVAHYNGVTLWSPGDAATATETLEWKGAHAGITFSPAGNFLVTKMKEPALQGWRLHDHKEMPMHGYSGRVQSIDWTCGGKWLATSGSQYLVLWPFEQSEHPLSNVPVLRAGYKLMATAVSCHPHQDVVAVGYADGFVLLIRIEDEAEILIKNSHGGPVSSMAWSADGAQLAIVCEDGIGRIIDFKSQQFNVPRDQIHARSAIASTKTGSTTIAEMRPTL